jgi:hypothetical protein
MMMTMTVSVSSMEKVDAKFVLESAPIKLNHMNTLALDLQPPFSTVLRTH